MKRKDRNFGSVLSCVRTFFVDHLSTASVRPRHTGRQQSFTNNTMSAGIMQMLYERLSQRCMAQVQKEGDRLRMTWVHELDEAADNLKVVLEWNEATRQGELQVQKQCPVYGVISGSFALPAKRDTLVWGNGAQAVVGTPLIDDFIPETMMLRWIPLALQVMIVPGTDSCLLSLHFGYKTCCEEQKEGKAGGGQKTKDDLPVFTTFAFTTVTKRPKALPSATEGRRSQPTLVQDRALASVKPAPFGTNVSEVFAPFPSFLITPGPVERKGFQPPVSQIQPQPLVRSEEPIQSHTKLTINRTAEAFEPQPALLPAVTIDNEIFESQPPSLPTVTKVAMEEEFPEFKSSHGAEEYDLVEDGKCSPN